MESRIQDAIEYLRQRPGSPVARVARRFQVPRNRLRYRLEGRPPKAGRKGLHYLLSGPEEKALCRYIDRLEKVNLAVRPVFVTDAANAILSERSSKHSAIPLPTIGQNWTTRFLKRYGYIKKSQKRVVSERKEAENLPLVEGYFKLLNDIIIQHGILPESI
jgi:Tc5 transposase-like DNA-binding protein